MGKIIVVGSANTDLTVKADRLPRPHETVTGGEFMVSYGGKGANQALAALRAGAAVTFLSKIGTDAFGDLLFDHLVRAGFSPQGLMRDPDAPAGVALIAVDRSGANQIVVAPGSNGRLGVQDIPTLEPHVLDASLLLIQLEVPLPTVEHVLRLAKSHGIATILNPAPFTPLPPAIYSLVDIITPNEREAGDLTGTEIRTVDEAQKAALVLHSRGVTTVIVTLGANGALLSHEETVKHYASFPVESVDTVAAGDAFNGALAAALARGEPIAEAIDFANAAGALCCTKRGAQESLPTRAEIEALLKSPGGSGSPG